MELFVVFPPLFAFLLALALGRVLGFCFSAFVTCAGVLCSAVFASLLLGGFLSGEEIARSVSLAHWISSGALSVSWGVRVDTLSVVMMVVVSIVSTCVHIYSLGYMAEDESKSRFMAYLSLFTFAMLMLVSADNLLQLFFGWEGVGVASYLLIGFWNKKESANAAAIKAFLVNRVGDFGLALGVFASFVVFGTVDFGRMFLQAPELAQAQIHFLGVDLPALTTICLLLFMGAMGKSAQIGLHTWLPDAMEGPTPVSALIHAATMVTAGVFLVARMSPVFEYAPGALAVVAVVGAITAFVAATIALVQVDIKRVIAYSTMSQLGYMFFALGVSAYGASIFHLMTHAFFKALLFLSAGSVIHALHHEQDMRKMGGLFRKLPFTYAMMWIGSLALAGVPFFAGYYSKDIILESAFASAHSVGVFAYWVGIAAAVMTAFYSGRLLFMTFHGQPRMDPHHFDHVHESPKVMQVPLFVLAIGALFAGVWGADFFVSHSHELNFWGQSLFVLPEQDSLAAAHSVALWVKILPVVAGGIGLFLAFVFYRLKPEWPAVFVARFSGPYRLFENKWYFDSFYSLLFVKGFSWLGRFFSEADRHVVDRLGPDGAAARSIQVGHIFRRFQNGRVFHYGFVMIFGLVALLSWLFIHG